MKSLYFFWIWFQTTFVENVTDVTDFAEFGLAFAFVELEIPFSRSFQHPSRTSRSSTTTSTPSISSNILDMIAWKTSWFRMKAFWICIYQMESWMCTFHARVRLARTQSWCLGLKIPQWHSGDNFFDLSHSVMLHFNRSVVVMWIYTYP